MVLGPLRVVNMPMAHATNLNFRMDYKQHCGDNIMKGDNMLLIESSHTILLTNCLNYFSTFGGICKVIAVVSHLFDAVYSYDFVYQVDSDPHYYNNSQMKQVHSNILALGSNVTLLLFRDIAPNQIEYKIS
jgi:hypothetical protein